MSEKRNNYPLSEKDEEELMGNLTGWALLYIKPHTLKKNVQLETFNDALVLLNDIAHLAQTEGHYPNFYLSFKTLVLTLYTPEVFGLSEKDFILAARIDELLNKKGLLS
ncbi:4a-hydroxytetrahydrobiopterin dehydratase [Chitinispirillales bacterium ANBcel5]|uniref:4a-hydroxytetrahydrobiopterin dehydratase n=1 Tax=Cellulosispirillum alkaliphilum TaxID=3039283 RepID=UPI002A54FD2F|nr:4a-hydroxytetrahydrobiopterin dehydratase [Chitinispirillales bacterium ANBcel5]